jgi:hypothetical protein
MEMLKIRCNPAIMQNKNFCEMCKGILDEKMEKQTPTTQTKTCAVGVFVF